LERTAKAKAAKAAKMSFADNQNIKQKTKSLPGFASPTTGLHNLMQKQSFIKYHRKQALSKIKGKSARNALVIMKLKSTIKEFVNLSWTSNCT